MVLVRVREILSLNPKSVVFAAELSRVFGRRRDLGGVTVGGAVSGVKPEKN